LNNWKEMGSEFMTEGKRCSIGRGVISSSWSSSMLSISEDTAVDARYMSSPNGLLTLFGERRGLEDLPIGSRLVGLDANAGLECALVIGGAASDAELDCERR
jgi:hypothetical protein